MPGKLETVSSPQTSYFVEVANNLNQAAIKALEGGDRYLSQVFLVLLSLILLVFPGCISESTQAPPTQQAPTVEATLTPWARVGKRLSPAELEIWNEFAKEYLCSDNNSVEWSFGTIEGFSFTLIRQVDALTKYEIRYDGLDNIVQFGDQPIENTSIVVSYSEHYYDLYTELLSILNLTTQQMLDIRNTSGLSGFRDAIKQKLAENKQFSDEELNRQANEFSLCLAYYFSTSDDTTVNRRYIEAILSQLRQ